jgi:hypothetical protein
MGNMESSFVAVLESASSEAVKPRWQERQMPIAKWSLTES